MTDAEIHENLCYYDPRQPDYDAEVTDGREPRSSECYCDNCFYGRDRLAMALLSGKRTEAWVLQLESYTKEPSYAREAFCGSTYDILEAHRFETEPKSMVGVAVQVIVVTKVETVT